MDAGSENVGDLGCSERGFSAPSNQTATPTDAPGDAFRALPANAAANVATATTASAAQGAMLLHGECEGFTWLATAAGLLFRERLLEHGAKGGFTDGAYRWLLLGTDADRPQGTAPGRGDRRQGIFS